MKRGALRAWLRSVPRGACPGCREPLPEGSTRRARICRRPECPGRKKYQQLYQQARRGKSRLRDVVTVTELDDGRRVRLTLGCGHVLERPKSKGRRGRRASCPTCPKRKRRRRRREE